MRRKELLCSHPSNTPDHFFTKDCIYFNQCMVPNELASLMGVMISIFSPFWIFKCIVLRWLRELTLYMNAPVVYYYSWVIFFL